MYDDENTDFTDVTITYTFSGRGGHFFPIAALKARASCGRVKARKLDYHMMFLILRYEEEEHGYME